MLSLQTDRVRSWLCSVACLFCFSLAFTHATRTARAQSPDDERARVHFVAGNAYFEAGQWDDAAREFEQAHALSGRPEMLVNLSRAHERAGHLQQAVDDLTLLLERYPLTAYKPEAEQRIAHLRSLLGAEAAPESEPPAPVPEAAGVSEASVSEPGVSQPESAPLQHKLLLWPPRWPTLVAAGATLAAAVSALGTGLSAHGRYGDLEKSCPDNACAPRYADDLARGQRLARASTGLSIVALTLASATAVLWFLDMRSLAAADRAANRADNRAIDRARIDLSMNGSHAEARLRLAF